MRKTDAGGIGTLLPGHYLLKTRKGKRALQHTPARPGSDRAFLFPGKIPDSSQDHRSCDKLFLGKSRGPAYVALTQATAGRVLPGES